MNTVKENEKVDDQSPTNPIKPSRPNKAPLNTNQTPINDDQSSTLYYVDERFQCWVIVTVVTLAAVVMLGFHIKQLFHIKFFFQKSTNQEAPLFIVLGVLTNAATAAGFSKPYAPAAVSIMGFFASVFLCVAVPGLWGWCEKFMLIVLPLVVGGQFFWLRHRARAQ